MVTETRLLHIVRLRSDPLLCIHGQVEHNLRALDSFDQRTPFQRLAELHFFPSSPCRLLIDGRAAGCRLATFGSLLIASILILNLPFDFLLLPQGIVEFLDFWVDPVVECLEFEPLDLGIEVGRRRLLNVFGLGLLLLASLFRRRPLELQRELSQDVDGRGRSVTANPIMDKMKLEMQRKVYAYMNDFAGDVSILTALLVGLALELNTALLFGETCNGDGPRACPFTGLLLASDDLCSFMESVCLVPV